MDAMERLINEEIEKAAARPVITAQQVAGWVAVRLDYHDPGLVDIVEDVLRSRYDPTTFDGGMLERYEMPDGSFKRPACMTAPELHALGDHLRRLGQADKDHADALRASRR